MQEPAITEELIEAHGIKPDEYARILQILNRKHFQFWHVVWREHIRETFDFFSQLFLVRSEEHTSELQSR